MAKDIFTAGQASGITQLPPTTIRRYVRTFSGFFSEPAKLDHKGRRFNGQDIKTLLTIRNLKSTHAGNEKILASLNGEIPQACTARFEETNALKIFSAARQELQQARQEINDFATVRRNEYITARDARELTKRFSKYMTQQDQTPDLLARLQSVESKLTKLIKLWNEQEENKPLLARFLGL